MSRRGRRASYRKAQRAQLGGGGGGKQGSGGGRDHSRQDPYQRKAHTEGYRARSAYKLEQIHGRFNLFRPGYRVLDLGAAPGGWSQVAAKLVNSNLTPVDEEMTGETAPEATQSQPSSRARRGQVLGIDLQTIQAWPGCTFIQGDLTDQETLDLVDQLLPKGQADVVISDMSPKLSGNYDMDQARSIFLAQAALAIATQWLRKGGGFVVKVFEGADFLEFKQELKEQFRTMRPFSPPASRKASSEIYLVAKGFKG